MAIEVEKMARGSGNLKQKGKLDVFRDKRKEGRRRGRVASLHPRSYGLQGPFPSSSACSPPQRQEGRDNAFASGGRARMRLPPSKKFHRNSQNEQRIELKLAKMVILDCKIGPEWN